MCIKEGVVGMDWEKAIHPAEPGIKGTYTKHILFPEYENSLTFPGFQQ